jgi:DNA polymerase elongation subunit (family B)
MDYRKQKVIIYERDIETQERLVKEWTPPYYFYVPDEEGEYESIFGDKLIRADFDSAEEHAAAIRMFPRRFESDIKPVARVMMDRYYNRPTPPVYYAFLDIEVDYKQSIGFAGPMNPYGPINAVTIYQSWTKSYITLAVPPPGWKDDGTFHQKIREGGLAHKFGFIPQVIICKDELELLEKMLDSIQESDIISGWNSEFYDLPYICERIRLVMGEHALRALELPGAPPPRKEMKNRFGNEEPIYSLSGRAHLDYLRLFEKFTFEGRTSYALANIALEELDIPKLEHEGTLEELYKNDFLTFCLYNIRDVEILVKLDEKFKFIALTNQMAHENTVPFGAILGTVKYVETGIANHAHYVLKKIVHDKNISQHDKVEGAVVLSPKIGLHEWIGSVDINSLYPNVIRSLNISPEKIVGQFTNVEDEYDWLAIYEGREDVRCILIFEGGEQQIKTAAEWKEILKKNKWALSAYGTVFDQGNGRGVVADILGFWYTERKRLQAEKKKWGKKVKELESQLGTALDIKGITFLELEQARKQEAHYDLLQLTKKIAMNSLYGALLNVAFRFGDMRMGASTTATGRRITKYMMETMGFLLTGTKDEVRKTRVWDDDELQILYHTDNEAIIYGDTDSCYYKTFATNKEEAIAVADAAAEGVNESFPEFMRTAFYCQNEFDNLIKAGREIVGERGLFQAKKKYMVKVVDLEGVAVNKMKSQGSEIKKADTPKIIQIFLKKTVDMILDGRPYEEMVEYVNSQRRAVLKDPKNVFLLGVSKQVNNLESKYAEFLQYKKMPSPKGWTIPGHVRASINYNELVKSFDPGAKAIKSGDKVLIYYVKSNQYGMKAVAMPADLPRFPQWFNENFQVDIKLTEQKMFDAKLGKVFLAIGKEVPTPQSAHIAKIVEYF